MDIVYCSDQTFVPYMAVSLVSLLENNKDANELTVYCILLDVKAESKVKIQSLSEKYGIAINLIDGKEYCEKHRFWTQEKDNKYIRLLLPKILNIDKVLYIDCDTTIIAPLDELWDTDIANYWVAAVEDTVYKSHKAEANLTKNDPYFNSGVMLINLMAWRDNKLLDAFMSAYNYTHTYIFNDQRVLNNVCNGHVLFLHPKYNMMLFYCRHKRRQIEKLMDGVLLYSEADLHEAKQQPIIAHYAGGSTAIRPWNTFCVHPLKERFYTYEKKSPIKVMYSQTHMLDIAKSILKRLIPFPVYVMIFRIRQQKTLGSE